MQATALTSAPITQLATIATLGAGDAPPVRLVLLRWGVNATPRGPVVVGMKSLQAATLWDGMGFGEIALDFDHNTVPSHPNYKGEPAPIAAMATPIVIVGEGLVLDKLKWTPTGAQRWREFAGVAPAVKLDPSGEVLMIHSAALTPGDVFDGLHLLSARGDGGISGEDRAVMNLLGISEATWLRDHGERTVAPRVATLSASGSGIPASERDVMKMLGISEADWLRTNGGGDDRVVTLSATIAPELHELVCKWLGAPEGTPVERLAEMAEAHVYFRDVKPKGDFADQLEGALKGFADNARRNADVLGVPLEQLLRTDDRYQLTPDDRRVLELLGNDVKAWLAERLAPPPVVPPVDERQAVMQIPAASDAGGRVEAKPLFEMLGVGGTQAMVQVLQQVAGGVITREAAINTLQIAFGVTKEEAERMIPAQGSAAPVAGAPTEVTTLAADLRRLCITEDDRKVMRQLNLSEADWLRYA